MTHDPRTYVLVTVAVGTAITGRPPHRSVQARLRIRLLPWMGSGKIARQPIPFPLTFPRSNSHVGTEPPLQVRHVPKIQVQRRIPTMRIPIFPSKNLLYLPYWVLLE